MLPIYRRKVQRRWLPNKYLKLPEFAPKSRNYESSKRNLSPKKDKPKRNFQIIKRQKRFSITSLYLGWEEKFVENKSPLNNKSHLHTRVFPGDVFVILMTDCTIN